MTHISEGESDLTRSARYINNTGRRTFLPFRASDEKIYKCHCHEEIRSYVGLGKSAPIFEGLDVEEVAGVVSE